MSKALESLATGIKEIEALQRANPSPIAGGGIARPAVTRALGRSEVVLLCSHLEYYVYSVFEEAAATVATLNTPSDALPPDLRLLHSRALIDEVAATSWRKRGEKLAGIATNLGPYWTPGQIPPPLDYEQLLAWMSTPSPKQLVRAFKYWGIENVFAAITRTDHHRRRLWLKISELTDKRNNIAHGDFTTEATYLDVRSYKRAVRDFCERSDKRMARQVKIISGAAQRPW